MLYNIHMQTMDGKMVQLHLGIDRFHFFEQRSFRFKNDKEKTKNRTVVFKNDSFSKKIVF